MWTVSTLYYYSLKPIEECKLIKKKNFLGNNLQKLKNCNHIDSVISLDPCIFTSTTSIDQNHHHILPGLSQWPLADPSASILAPIQSMLHTETGAIILKYKSDCPFMLLKFPNGCSWSLEGNPNSFHGLKNPRDLLMFLISITPLSHTLDFDHCGLFSVPISGLCISSSICLKYSLSLHPYRFQLKCHFFK